MKISLIINFDKNSANEIANKVVDMLHNNKVEILCDSVTKETLSNNIAIVDENHLQNCDFCVVIGGDGTIIHTAKIAAIYSKAVLGINVGRIGYLAAIKSTELDYLNNILNGEYEIEERIMLDVKKLSDNNEENYTAFNDAVITKGTLSRMLDMKLLVDGHEIKYRSDGLIISTPTGSTAYALSAGGPVIDPRVNDILITPICPYSFFTRPMIVPSFSDVSITADVLDNKEAYLTIDGELAVKIEQKDKIVISRSKTSVKLISLKHRPGYYSLGTSIK